MKSVITGVEHTRNIPVNPDDYMAWIMGRGNIQELMHYLSDDDREFLISGITPGEWDSVFHEQLKEEI